MLNINQIYNNYKNVIDWSLLSVVIGYYIIKASKQKLLFDIFKGQPINLAVIIIFSLVMILYKTENKEEYERRIDALKKAIFGLLIAVLAHIGMPIGPFWIIFFIAYHLDGWV